MSAWGLRGRTAGAALLVALLLALGTAAVLGAGQRNAAEPAEPASPADVLSAQQWEGLERSVDRALAWLASQQQRDGRFPTIEHAQPAVTCLILMAFLSRGHVPGEGPYGEMMDRGLDFVLKCQQRDGLICLVAPAPTHGNHNSAHTATYNHAISGLLLCEMYGMADRSRCDRIRPVVERALDFSRGLQLIQKRRPVDVGGWRYIRRATDPTDSDLSVTSWYLLFLRSAKNAGFDIPSQHVDEAMAYVKRCYDPQLRRFLYSVETPSSARRAMDAAGILALSLGGLHNTQMAHAAADRLLSDPFPGYNRPGGGRWERYHYGIFYGSLAMFQLGGRYWQSYYPPLVRLLLANQNTDGSWDPEAGEDHCYGNAYSTALVVMTLTPPYQMLPIFQR